MKLKRMGRLVMMAGALILCTVIGTGKDAQAHRNWKETSMVQKVESREHAGDVLGMGEIQIGLQVASENSLLRTAAANGNVTAEGVRLRKKPSSTAKVLELLYNRESVVINYTKSLSVTSGDWYYVKRVRTGTWGWVNCKYVSHWD